MKRFFMFCWKAGLFFVLFSALLVVVLRFLPVSYTPLMFIRCVQNAGSGEHEVRIRHDWIHADDIPDNLRFAVVCSEDQRFLTHHGFDFESIQKAMEEAEHGGRSRGASTISQQTAKNVFLWPTSSFLRKGFEAWFTVLIELFWDKERILEVYLNSIEFGDGIYGCEAAAQHFFKKPASELTQTECARLAAVLPNPIRYNAGKPSQHIIRRQNWVLGQMRNYGTMKFHEEETTTTKEKPRKRKK